MKITDYINRAYENARAKGFHDKPREFGTSIALIHSELSEMLEAHRKGDWQNVHEEAADVFIRLCDLCGEYDIDLENEVLRKMAINEGRPIRHGKRY